MSYRKPPAFKDHPIGFGEALSRQMFRAICYQVIDGDTADFLVDLGWYQYSYAVLRFDGIDTSEIRAKTAEEREHAQAAKKRVEELILNKPVLIESKKQATTFGRFVANIYFTPPPEISITTSRSFSVEENFGMISLIQLLKDEGFEKKK